MAALPSVTVNNKAAPTQKPAKQAAAQRVQRYWNKGTGRMETAKNFQHAAPHPAQHQAQRQTQQTTTRTTTRQPVSFINQSPAEIEARAKAIVGSEIKGIQSAYEPQQTLLGQQQQGALNAHATSYGQLGSTVTGLQGQQATAAKTYENYAADALNSAATAAPGAAEAAERLGLKPGEAEPESVRRQQESARTLLSGIAQAGAAGTNERQANESNFLTNIQASTAQANAEGARNIEGQYALQKGKLTASQAADIAKATGGQTSLVTKLQGEQEKDRIAATGLGYKGITTESKVKSERTKEQQGKEKLVQSGKKLGVETEYKRATLAEKERQDNVKNAQAEQRITQTGEKNAAKTRLKLTPVQLKKVSEELGGAFTTFERLRSEKEAYSVIRQKLASGQEGGRGTIHYYKGKPIGESEGKRIKIPKVADNVVVRAAEEAWNYHQLSPQTMQQLAAKGLSFTSQREAYETISGKPYTPPSPAKGVKGGVKA